jgi:hypothetical protein
MRSVRMLAAKAVLLGTMAAPFLVLPIFGQQEVDPTNYPLSEATKTVARSPKPAMTHPKQATSAAHKRASGKKSVRLRHVAVKQERLRAAK